MASSSIEIIVRVKRASFITRVLRFPKVFIKQYKTLGDNGIPFFGKIRLAWAFSSLMLKVY